MDKQSAFKLLVEARNCLNKIKVPYFLSCGTLLGAIRENDFIGHDLDVDLGIFIKDWKKEIAEEFQKAGFKFTRKLGTNDLGLEYTFQKYGINLDLFFFYEEKDYVFGCGWWRENKPENVIKNKYGKFSLKPYKFKGEEFIIPDNPEKYLTEKYGDWKTPDPSWHWASSGKNTVQAPFDVTKDKTVSLCMITKNEAKILKETLKAVKPFIDYYVICDTGSMDNTKEVVKEILGDVPGEFVERPWVNFGHNRTEAIELCKGKADYSLVLDSDMIVSGSINKKQLIADSYNIKFQGSPTYYLPLLLKNDCGWKSVGVTHEYWYSPENKVKEILPNFSIWHKCNGDYRKRKFEKDAELLVEGLKQEPNNSRYMFYLAQSLKDCGQYEKAIQWYEKRISMGGWKEEVAFSRQMVVWCLIKLDRSIQEIAGEAESCFNYNSANAEAMYYLLSHCRVKGYYKYGYEIGKRIQGVKPPKTFLFMDPTVYQHKILDELSICAYWVGQYKESYELCEKLLRMDCVPLRDKKRIEKNKSFSENK